MMDASRGILSTRDVGCTDPARSGSRDPERQGNRRVYLVFLGYRDHKCNAGMTKTTIVRMFSGTFVRNGGEGQDWMGVGLKEGG